MFAAVIGKLQWQPWSWAQNSQLIQWCDSQNDQCMNCLLIDVQQLFSEKLHGGASHFVWDAVVGSMDIVKSKIGSASICQEDGSMAFWEMDKSFGILLQPHVCASMSLGVHFILLVIPCIVNLFIVIPFIVIRLNFIVLTIVIAFMVVLPWVISPLWILHIQHLSSSFHFTCPLLLGDVSSLPSRLQDRNVEIWTGRCRKAWKTRTKSPPRNDTFSLIPRVLIYTGPRCFL